MLFEKAVMEPSDDICQNWHHEASKFKVKKKPGRYFSPQFLSLNAIFKAILLRITWLLSKACPLATFCLSTHYFLYRQKNVPMDPCRSDKKIQICIKSRCERQGSKRLVSALKTLMKKIPNSCWFIWTSPPPPLSWRSESILFQPEGVLEYLWEVPISLKCYIKFFKS